MGLSDLFSRGQVSREEYEAALRRLETELRRLGSELRQLQGEQMLMHDQVRKWMRRAVAAERVAQRVTPASPEIPASLPLRTTPARGMWGARARIAARRARALNGPEPEQPELEPEGEDDGVHS